MAVEGMPQQLRWRSHFPRVDRKTEAAQATNRVRQYPTFLLDQQQLVSKKSAPYDARLNERRFVINHPFTWFRGWGIATMGLLLSSVTFAQLPGPPAPVEAEVERVIVTGSNIPSAEETGPNPVDMYRPADIEKMGIRNATDLTTF